jgi:SNF2 family DNA or RNA helicase
MTGTPVSETPDSAFPILKVIGGGFIPNEQKFKNYFSIKELKQVSKTKKVNKLVGYKNLGELKTRIERVSIRRTKADMKGFPDFSSTIRNVYLSGKQLSIYKIMCGEIAKGLDPTINIAKWLSDSDGVKIRQFLNHPMVLGEDAESAKHKEIDSILDELFLDPEQKIILWTEYVAGVDLLYDRYNKKYGVIKLYGKTKIDEDMVKSFESIRGGPRIAAAIPAKAGTGTDWLARARTAVYVDRPYSYILYRQSMDRIHRRVSSSNIMSELETIRSKPATVVFLDVVNSVDEMVREKLIGKTDLSEAITIKNEKLISMGKKELLKYLK